MKTFLENGAFFWIIFPLSLYFLNGSVFSTEFLMKKACPLLLKFFRRRYVSVTFLKAVRSFWTMYKNVLLRLTTSPLQVLLVFFINFLFPVRILRVFCIRTKRGFNIIAFFFIAGRTASLHWYHPAPHERHPFLAPLVHNSLRLQLCFRILQCFPDEL